MKRFIMFLIVITGLSVLIFATSTGVAAHANIDNGPTYYSPMQTIIEYVGFSDDYQVSTIDMLSDVNSSYQEYENIIVDRDFTIYYDVIIDSITQGYSVEEEIYLVSIDTNYIYLRTSGYYDASIDKYIVSFNNNHEFSYDIYIDYFDTNTNEIISLDNIGSGTYFDLSSFLESNRINQAIMIKSLRLDINLNDYEVINYVSINQNFWQTTPTDRFLTWHALNSGDIIVQEIINPDFASWLVDGVGAFMNFEIIPGWSLATILSVMIGIPLLIYILRLFFGG